MSNSIRLGIIMILNYKVSRNFLRKHIEFKMFPNSCGVRSLDYEFTTVFHKQVEIGNNANIGMRGFTT